jgi:hypothetical protein
MNPQAGRLLFTATMALPAAVAAQGSPIQRGAIQIAGSAQVSHSRDIESGAGTTSVGISPRVGFFVTRGLELSANLAFQRISADVQRGTAWGVGPGATYYFDVRSRTFYPYLSAVALLTWSTLDSPSSVLLTELKTTDFTWQASGGGLFMIGSHVGITGELFYRREHVTLNLTGSPDQVQRQETYGLQWGIAAFLFK